MGTVLAKHGYTVEFGYFNGTCHGSGQVPIQTDRFIADQTSKGLEGYAADCESSAKRLKSGSVHPTHINTGRTKLDPHTYTHEPVYIEWAQGTPYQQRVAVERAVAEAERDARHARDHARSLREMADRLHGTALVAIVDLQPTPKAPKPMVDVQTAKVHGTFASKAARKAELDKITRAFEACTRELQALYLALPLDQRTDAKEDVYYAPMYPHQWRPEHSAAALREFPQAGVIVAKIEELVAAREAVKNAP
jgi:hypothetical protein